MKPYRTPMRKTYWYTALKAVTTLATLFITAKTILYFGNKALEPLERPTSTGEILG